jgi:hypothetical protein
MTPAVSFPNIEALCVQFLASAFTARGDSVHVSTRMPSPRPERAVRVSRTGGGRINVGLDAPQVLFECWAPSDFESSELARVTRALVGTMESFGSEMGSVVNYPDGSGIPRYQFAVQMFTAGETL